MIRLFIATNLEPGELSRDPDEFMEVVRVSFSEALEMVRDGRIVDAKSMATILLRIGLCGAITVGTDRLGLPMCAGVCPPLRSGVPKVGR